MVFSGCGRSSRQSTSTSLLVLHAGSLSVPFRDMADAFKEVYPEIDIRLESHGSRTCARHITELGREVDVFVSADSEVITSLLMPEHTGFVIEFATNEMVIAYTPRSIGGQDIHQGNWFHILLRKGVEYGHSDPDSDPCGYRALLTWKLSEKYYQEEGLYDRLNAGMPRRNIRPKEVDLLALLESGELDYIFIYRSVARQHGLRILPLPPEVNLSTPDHALFYQSVSISLSGRNPGEKIERTGAAMVYGLTIPYRSPNRERAIAFVKFILSSRGRKIMETMGQPFLDPVRITGGENLPAGIKGIDQDG
jgi:molybdate/tungstate transport system substrate-binding protein